MATNLKQKKTRAPISTQRQAQPVHCISAKRGCLKRKKGCHEYTASSPTNTQHQCQKRMLKKTKAQTNTQHQAQPAHGINAKRGC